MLRRLTSETLDISAKASDNESELDSLAVEPKEEPKVDGDGDGGDRDEFVPFCRAVVKLSVKLVFGGAPAEAQTAANTSKPPPTHEQGSPGTEQ